MAANTLHCWDGLYRGSATHKAKLTEADIPVIRRLYQQGHSTRAIAARYCVDHTAIWYAVTRRPMLKADGSVSWRYYTWNHVADTQA